MSAKMIARADEARTAERWNALQAYFAASVLDGDRFVCRHEAACKASHGGRFIEGQLHYLGKHFDLTLVDASNGILNSNPSIPSRVIPSDAVPLHAAPLYTVPLRVVIVGQEVGGGEPHETMAERRARVLSVARDHRFKREAEHPGRNQHMKGVTNVLRLLFGNGLGTDYAGEFLTFEDGSRHHIFECFALVNYLICSAISADPNARSRRGESTTVMRRNCNEHFRAVLERLQPTVIVVEGKSIWPFVRRAFDGVEQDDENDTLFHVRIAEREAWALSLTHPSAMHPHNWGSNEHMPYLLQRVVPAVQALHNRLNLLTKL